MQLLVLLVFVVPDELHNFLGTHDIPQAVRCDDYEPLYLWVERVDVYVRSRGNHKLSTTRAEGPEVTQRSRDAQEWNQINLFAIGRGAVVSTTFPDDTWNSLPADHHSATYMDIHVQGGDSNRAVNYPASG